MSDMEMVTKIKERNRLKEAIATLQSQVDLIDTQLKEEMTNRALEELLIDEFVVRYKEITSSKFDTKKFKCDLGNELYNRYCSPTVCMRFTIS